ncbi:unnamed protein product, partial [Laminaria digitata]
ALIGPRKLTSEDNESDSAAGLGVQVNVALRLKFCGHRRHQRRCACSRNNAVTSVGTPGLPLVVYGWSRRGVRSAQHPGSDRETGFLGGHETAWCNYYGYLFDA